VIYEPNLQDPIPLRNLEGQPDENQFADVFPRYEYFFKWYGFDDNHLIRACGVMDKGDVENRPDVIELAERTAEKLVT
jgi:hypothetical protein